MPIRLTVTEYLFYLSWEFGSNPTFSIVKTDYWGGLDTYGITMGGISEVFLGKRRVQAGSCSDECSRKQHQKHMNKVWEDAKLSAEEITCAGCGREPLIAEGDYGYPEIETFDKHHINYHKDETVLVCKQCHGKIARKDKQLERLFPIGRPTDKPKKIKIKKVSQKQKKCKTKHLYTHPPPETNRPDLSKLWLEFLPKNENTTENAGDHQENA